MKDSYCRFAQPSMNTDNSHLGFDNYHKKNSQNGLPNRAIKSSMLKDSILKDGSLKNKMIWSALMVISIASISPITNASVELAYQDWQVACDNTRTCRLAGYQAENNSDFPISVLLIRRAGSDAIVTGKVKLGGAKESSTKALLQLGNRHRMSLFINDKDFGETMPFSAVTGDAELTAAQVTALLEALTKSSKIELVLRNSRWELSDKGATAVMLKADEAQGRVGTPSAFVNNKDASKSNDSVLAAKPAPQLRLVMPNTRAVSSSKKKFSMKASKLSELMKGTISDVNAVCPNLTDKSSWRINRLNGSQLLVQHSCWTGAYNAGSGMWVINDNKPYDPVLVTTEATEYKNGKISSIQKGRGIGDCVYRIDWIWNGKRFEKSHESTTGLCRMIEAGGAWQMPIYVSEVNTSR